MSIATNHIVQTDSSKQAIQKANSMGLTLTSGWRSPEHNAAIGGSKTSMHVHGTAFDFSGSQAQMDSFAKWAKRSGLFTEVLWQVAGHYDHVHVGWGTGKHNGMYTGGATSEGATATDDKPGMISNVFSATIKLIIILGALLLGVIFFMQAFPV